jgi:hypothetical protein
MGQDTSEVRHEVEEAREHLGDTVEALAYKANTPKRIKDRAAEKVAEARHRIETDPRAAKLRSGAHSLKDTVGHPSSDDSAGGTPAQSGSMRDRIEPAVTTIRRLPPAITLAAVASLIMGLVLGRKLGERTSY